MTVKHARIVIPRNVSPVVRERWQSLRLIGNRMRGLYGVPVFLVGSALRQDNDDPRDIDIRMMLSESDFARRYGDPQKWSDEGSTGRWTRIRWRWSDDCVKLSRDAWAHTRLNCDVQVYPKRHADLLYKKKRRVRIDSRGRP
jgi:hypothetical protein